MNCRKCGCGILEDFEHCPMCGAKQRHAANRGSKAKDNKNTKVLKGTSKQRLNLAIVAIISVLATLAIVAARFFLINGIGFDGTVSSQNRELNEHYFFLNQMNNATSRGNVYFTADSVYIISPNFGEIVIFDRDFNEESVIRVQDEWEIIENLYVTDDAIYYTVLFEGYLYRYDRETSQNQQIADNIFRQTIIGDHVFYLSESWDDSNLYVFDKAHNETRILFEGDIRQFSINIHDNTILFIDDLSLYRMGFNGDNLEQLSDDTWGFAFDGEMIIWYTLSAEIFMMDLNIGEEILVAEGIDPFSVLFTENYVVFMDWLDNLHVANLSYNDSRQLAVNVINYAIVGDYIVYEHWDTFDIHVMDFYGNSRMLIEDEWR